MGFGSCISLSDRITGCLGDTSCNIFHLEELSHYLIGSSADGIG